MSALASPRELGYRFPAEWEPQRATWLAWPHRQSDWPGKLAAVQWAYCEMIAALTRHQRVGLLVSEAERGAAETCLRRSGIGLTGIDWLAAETDRSWTRDSFPTWLLGPQPESPLGAVKFHFNAWARYPEHALDEAAGQWVARARAPRVWLPRLASGARLVLEGGAIDGDGQGTLLTTEQCLLGRQFVRNPGASQAELEQLLQQYLCVDRILWLPGGIAGDDTSGHVDDLARFVAPGKIVLAQEPNGADENHRPLAAAREALQGARDARGRRIEVIPLPMPAARSFDAERLPASYANFLLANGLVLVPTFNDKADRQVLGLFAELFPQREVVGIHCGDLILGLGALHCSSHEEPAGAKP